MPHRAVCSLPHPRVRQAARYPDLQWLVALSIGLVGLVGVGTYPLVIELGVEATYPIDQTYSNSLIFIPGQRRGWRPGIGTD